MIFEAEGDRKIIVAEKHPFFCPRCDHWCGQTTSPHPFEIRVRA